MNYGSPLLDLLWAAVHAGFQASQRREGQYHTYRASDDGSERSTRAFFIVRQKTLRGTILTVLYCGTSLYKMQEQALVSAGYRSTSWYLVAYFPVRREPGLAIAFCCSTDSVQPKH